MDARLYEFQESPFIFTLELVVNSSNNCFLEAVEPMDLFMMYYCLK